MGSTRRAFTPEYKEQSVAFVIDGGRPVAEVARHIGVHEMTLGKWVKVARDAAEAGKNPDAPLGAGHGQDSCGGMTWRARGGGCGQGRCGEQDGGTGSCDASGEPPTSTGCQVHSETSLLTDRGCLLFLKGERHQPCGGAAITRHPARGRAGQGLLTSTLCRSSA